MDFLRKNGFDVTENFHDIPWCFRAAYDSGKPMEDGAFGGSTDVGDVSHCVPAIMPCIGLDCPEVMIHTAEFREATITEAGDNAMKWGAEAMALTALKVMEDPDLLKAIRAEFEEAKKDF